MAYRISLEDYKVNTILTKSTYMSGELRFDSSLRIDGKFDGKVFTDGVLVIGPEAEVRADLKAGVVVVAGKVFGNIEASERVEMLEGGQVYGNVKTAKLRIDDGVIFEGECHMLR